MNRLFLMLVLLVGCMGYEPIEGEPPDPPENYAPIVESYRPADVTVKMQVGSIEDFQVLSVIDPNGDRFFGYHWELDGNIQAYGSLYRFTGTNVGARSLVVKVWDCPGVGVGGDLSRLNQCQQKPFDNSKTAVFAWTIVVEP